MPGHLGAVSLKKSHDIVISSFCNIVKGQAKYDFNILRFFYYPENFLFSFFRGLVVQYSVKKILQNGLDYFSNFEIKTLVLNPYYWHFMGFF